MLHYFQEQCKFVSTGGKYTCLNNLEVNKFYEWIQILFYSITYVHIISINNSCTSACDLKRSVGCKIALNVILLLQLFVFKYALNFRKH